MSQDFMSKDIALFCRLNSAEGYEWFTEVGGVSSLGACESA